MTAKEMRRKYPIIFLRHVYYGMKRRIKTKKRKRYVNMKICNINDFIQKFINNKNFQAMYNNWKINNYKRLYVPTIDRINNQKGYLINNIEFISLTKNSGKDHKKKIILENLYQRMLLDSHTEAANYLGVSLTTIYRYKNNKKEYMGYMIYES